MSEQEREYRVPVAYMMGNVISVYKTETQLRQELRENPIDGIDPEASQEAFFAGYNKYIKEVVLKQYYIDIQKDQENEAQGG